MSTPLDRARAVADAVLYEGYLLYPYRGSSRKNQVRWQFGVLGPPGAAAAGVGEEPDLAVECLLRPDGGGAEPAVVDLHLRLLHLQRREVQRRAGEDWEPVDRLVVGEAVHIGWDEAAERELALGTFALDALIAGVVVPVEVPGGEDVEELRGPDGALAGRLVRRRAALSAVAEAAAEPDGGLLRVRVRVANTGPDPDGDKDAALRTSLLGAHLLLGARGAAFLSLTDPPDAAVEAAARCRQHRCWPVLVGSAPDGAAGSSDLVLASPIILGDHPEVAPESAGDLFDATEIDEILTLRVLTMTAEEKAEARATDARAAAIVDRCEAMSPEQLQRLHGALRDPHGADVALPEPDPFDADPFDTGGAPWWDPATDAAVDPLTDTVLVGAVRVGRGSVVRLRPTRRADAQDLFFAGQVARVTAVHRDVDGQVHVAVVLVDDPAADLHDWYGRYLHFAPEEIDVLDGAARRPAPAGEEGPR